MPPATQSSQRGRSDPNMVTTEDRPDADPLSPTTLVINYLKSKGLPLTAENMRRTVEANMRDPGVLGADPVAGLRNTQIEDSAPASGGKRTSAPPFPQPINPSWQTVQPWPAKSPDDSFTPLRNIGTPDLPPPPEVPPPPVAPAPVGAPPAPQAPPPTPGAANALPPPDPIRDAITRAIGGPPETPALPAPPVRPAIAAPPEVPALPAPSPQLALPAPEAPNVVGQSGRPALPAPQPDIGPKIAPGPRVQGAPIIASPAQKAIPKIVGGVLTRNPAMIGAGAASAAPEIMDIAKTILGR